ncbi:MAG: ATP-binding cassette domain-containing protein [Bifidobacteriaceae bacterium]|nr:ATP-binding cassette domain-containing protein [Bifidobacteriaceae bacterium]
MTPPAKDTGSTFVDGVSFAYGKRKVFSDLSLRLSGGVTGLLGPNGAGKTTLLNLLATVQKPAAGQIVVAGHDTATAEGLKAARKALGFLPQRFEVMGMSSAADNVAYAAWAHGVPESGCAAAAADALAVVGLADRAKDRARALSGGMRQRLGIACAIAHRPAVLLLDEPTVGLDPDQRVATRRYLESVARTAPVLMSTHMVDDLAMIASNVAVLAGGRIRFSGTLDEFEVVGRSSERAAGRFASPLEVSYGVVSARAREEGEA